jgi:hypothetical protein
LCRRFRPCGFEIRSRDTGLGRGPAAGSVDLYDSIEMQHDEIDRAPVALADIGFYSAAYAGRRNFDRAWRHELKHFRLDKAVLVRTQLFRLVPPPSPQSKRNAFLKTLPITDPDSPLAAALFLRQITPPLRTCPQMLQAHSDATRLRDVLPQIPPLVKSQLNRIETIDLTGDPIVRFLIRVLSGKRAEHPIENDQRATEVTIDVAGIAAVVNAVMGRGIE